MEIINELTSMNRKVTRITKLINIADVFSGYFSSIGPKLADNMDVNEGSRSYVNIIT